MSLRCGFLSSIGTLIESHPMSTAVQGLLATFECLTTEERQEAFAELIRRTRDLEYPPLDDETIDRIADESFLEYDRREGEDAGR